MADTAMTSKERLAAPEITIMPGIHDTYSALTVELPGFGVAWISGVAISESHLGWADRDVMGLREHLTTYCNIVNCMKRRHNDERR